MAEVGQGRRAPERHHLGRGTARSAGPAAADLRAPLAPPPPRARSILGTRPPERSGRSAIAMTHRQRQSRRRRRGGGHSKVLLALRRTRHHMRHRRAVAGRLRARDRGHRARPERAEAERQGRELGDLRRRRLAARLRALGHGPHGGPLARHPGRRSGAPRWPSRTSASTSTRAWTTTRSSAPASATSSPARPCRAARRSPSSSCAPSTSRTRSATSPRKIREAKLASELEDERSKTWILHNYLNDIPYGTVGGRTAIGVEAAAVTFFAKHARELTLGRGGPARRPAAGALAVQPVPQPQRRAGPAQRGARPDGRERLHHEAEADAASAARSA